MLGEGIEFLKVRRINTKSGWFFFKNIFPSSQKTVKHRANVFTAIPEDQLKNYNIKLSTHLFGISFQFRNPTTTRTNNRSLLFYYWIIAFKIAVTTVLQMNAKTMQRPNITSFIEKHTRSFTHEINFQKVMKTFTLLVSYKKDFKCK